MSASWGTVTNAGVASGWYVIEAPDRGLWYWRAYGPSGISHHGMFADRGHAEDMARAMFETITAERGGDDA